MGAVWVCALAAFMQLQQSPAPDAAPAQRQLRTKVLPGAGYIRYEVLPGDDEQPAGELTVTHAESNVTATPDSRSTDALPPRAARTPDGCSAVRGKLAQRILEVEGLKLDEDVALWVDRETRLTRPMPQSGLAGEPLLIQAMRNDSVTRDLAVEVARCESARP